MASLACAAAWSISVSRLEWVLPARDLFGCGYFFGSTTAYDGHWGAIHAAPGPHDFGTSDWGLAHHAVWLEQWGAVCSVCLSFTQPAYHGGPALDDRGTSEPVAKRSRNRARRLLECVSFVYSWTARIAHQ